MQDPISSPDDAKFQRFREDLVSVTERARRIVREEQDAFFASYAVLGLLALREWSAYDLARQAERSLRFAWPKSERHLYTEPKKLVTLGYARLREESAGPSRTRHVYSITGQGRRALEEWAANSRALSIISSTSRHRIAPCRSQAATSAW